MPESPSASARLKSTVSAPNRTRVALGAVAGVIFLASLVACLSFGFGEGSIWIKMTQPYEPTHAPNSLLGFSCLYGGSPFHLENTGFVGQMLLFSGLSLSGLDMYVVRPIYAYLASIVAPFTGIIPAMALTNLVAWALAVFITWRFARLAFKDDLAAAIAAILAAGGFGFIAHVGDYSAHLLSFTVYYLGVYVIYASNVWRERCSLGTHLALGAFLAICCLQYNTGLLLLAGYICLGVFHNRWRDIAVALLIALTAQRIWVLVLKLALSLVDKSFLTVDFYATESSYLTLSLAEWVRIAHTPSLFVKTFLTDLVKFFCFDSPLIVAAGLAAIFLVRPRPALLRFSVCMGAFPFLAGMLYSQHMVARGCYLVYGVSILIYSAIGAAFADLLRRSVGTTKRVALWGGLAVLILCHFAWSYAAFAGNPGPLKYYFLSGTNNLAAVASPPFIASITGEEARPRLFDGSSTLVRAGAAIETSKIRLPAPRISLILIGMALRALLGLYFGLMIFLAARHFGNRSAVRLSIGIASLTVLIPLIFGPALIRQAPAFLVIHARQLPGHPKEIAYSINVAKGVRQRIELLDPAVIKTEVYFAGAGANFTGLGIFVNDHQIRAKKGTSLGLWNVPTAEPCRSL